MSASSAAVQCGCHGRAHSRLSSPLPQAAPDVDASSARVHTPTDGHGYASGDGLHSFPVFVLAYGWQALPAVMSVMDRFPSGTGHVSFYRDNSVVFRAQPTQSAHKKRSNRRSATQILE